MLVKLNALVALALTALLSSASAEAARKYNPGHYIALGRNESSQSTMTASIKPGVTGMMKRYTWRSLEPSKGNYDFSEIKRDLDWASAYGMKLVVMVEDKTFKLERPTPGYLDALTPRNRAGGYTAVRWNPTVVERMKALLNALGRFDSHWAFQGVALQETALSFDDAILNNFGYTPEKYRDAYIGILTTGANAMPNSRMFWFMNFFPRRQDYIASVANAVAAKGVVMGGPDVLPDNGALKQHSYPFYDQFQFKMPLLGQVEAMCYSHLHKTSGYPTKYWTMAELFRFARDQLHVDYMFWVRMPKPNVPDGYDWTDALPVIANNPSF
ncbi:MAG TPA: hypothetical protein VFX69_08805 [Steroidobacteraceae bacterium]|jgi:hypothetical protein|nr:hypothetical protein [Steroidobacteraceae bacterium]